MSEPYLGEIRMFAGNFAPRNNAYCSGQILGIQQNTALFSLLGTYYGGNGQTTFALPDLRGRIPVSMGQGPGLSNYTIGEQTGTESVTITTNTTPMHTHMMIVSGSNANAATPVGNQPAAVQAPYTGLWVSPANGTGNDPMNANSLLPIGGNQPHENRMPALAISFIIALQGVFPSRN
ncbi:MAG: tail fiber protein [Rhizomicrobium sp.]